MFCQSISKLSFLISYVWWINILKNRQHSLAIILLTLKNLDKFVQAPSGRYKILREYNYRNPWTFNCFKKFGWNFFSLWELIIYEGVNTMITQNAIQIARKAIVSVFTSEIQEHIISASLFVGETSHQIWIYKKLGRSKRKRRKKDVMKLEM